MVVCSNEVEKMSKVKKKKIRRSTGEQIFTIFNYAFFVALCLIMLYPFWHVVMMSFSSVEATAKGGIFLWPKGFNLDTYEKVFKDPSIWTGYLTTIVVTIAGTVLGTLFTAVGYWNDYFSSVLYINSKDKWALQAVLRYMLTNTNQAMQSAGVTVTAVSNVTAATIKAASIIVATVPILCVYPFVQKYFVKGVMIGGVKG